MWEMSKDSPVFILQIQKVRLKEVKCLKMFNSYFQSVMTQDLKSRDFNSMTFSHVESQNSVFINLQLMLCMNAIATLVTLPNFGDEKVI